jgi:hypothetical protein
MTDLPWQAALLVLMGIWIVLLVFGIWYDQKNRINIHDHWPCIPYSLRDKK